MLFTILPLPAVLPAGNGHCRHCRPSVPASGFSGKRAVPVHPGDFFGDGAAFENFQNFTAFFIDDFFRGGFGYLKAQGTLDQSCFRTVFS
ncbi:MAG: hypothetical protein J6S19_01075 [Lentisphaeria bacterium]|nr:hypothetical protein [Lentisphaeria bacterium]